MNRAESYLSARLQERADAGNLRRLPAIHAGVDLCSNDYLGIATHGLPQAFMPYDPGTGATGSRLISGNSAFAEETETFIAAFHSAEAALIFNSGYDANTGLLSAIAGRDTVFIYDELCHASIIDGMRLSLCRHKYRFAHNDLVQLEELLQKHSTAGQVIVVVESVYSMDGDTAPLAAIADLCDSYEAQLVVDEAHATGVIGPRGEGLVCALGLHERVFARVHTFGKALGCHGAAIVGSAVLRQYLINFARSFIYTTALPPHAISVIGAVYRYLASPGFSNAALHDNIAYFHRQADETGIPGLLPGASAIQAVVTGGNEPTRQLAAALRDAGLLVHPILHPTVPLGMERLRICLHSFNTLQEIDLLVKTLQQWAGK
ncbi:pyridoxal phosphate-dependent aminotransferase family protein [Nemorincola caseinilytica]|uniref:Pyridoxal phosphate-dependent aminotransferase family protein n=1 Tax=Nemorincola caseinilytica TaxID=2054315 RepID=A0ABP8NIC7_9BACT